MKVNLLFAWYDLWIGFFWDSKKSWLYILPIPCFGIILKLPHKRYWLISNSSGNIIGSTTKGELEHCYKVDNVYSKMYWAKNGDTAPIFGTDYNIEEKIYRSAMPKNYYFNNNMSSVSHPYCLFFKNSQVGAFKTMQDAINYANEHDYNKIQI